MNRRPARAYTFSAYSNAYAIYRGARELGIVVFTDRRKNGFAMPYGQPELEDDWLVFTEEASLRRALQGDLKGRFLPARFPIDLLDNKWAFATWLSTQPDLTPGLRQWSLEEKQGVEYPCVLKAKHSWNGPEKLPRGWICHSNEELQTRLANLHASPGWERLFFLQEWLEDTKCRVISVCGFHDTSNSARNLTAVVERIASHEPGMSCSAAVATVADEWQLCERSRKILDALDFVGPFEIEYIIVGERVLVLELNPRFWMQHAIFFDAGNGLLRRYFGMDTAEDRGAKEVGSVVWVDGLHLLRKVLKLDLKLISFVTKKIRERDVRLMIWPPLPSAAVALWRSLWHKVVARLSLLARVSR